jgi:hypothetical protein
VCVSIGVFTCRSMHPTIDARLPVGKLVLQLPHWPPVVLLPLLLVGLSIASGDRECRTAVVLDILSYLRKAFFPAGHHRDRESFAREAAGDRSP